MVQAQAWVAIRLFSLKALLHCLSVPPSVFHSGGVASYNLEQNRQKRNTHPPQNQRSNHAIFPPLILMGGRGELILSILIRACLLGEEHLPEQNQTSSLLINTAKCSNPNEHECINT